MTWQLSTFALLVLALAAGFAWYERERPPARVLALVAAMAALAVVGRLAFAAIPNVKPTTDIVLFAGYALGAVPGFAVGAVTAVVSNLFFSQGPWTVWQMAGWGAVGVGGAGLARALRGREPGRLTLAAVCGVAGLVFGAWMDVYQWTLAARQDVDTYLAISATSLPYNLAHAIGNVGFALLIGPAFVRALRRYRRRFEVRWPPPAGAATGAAALLCLCCALGVGAASARAVTPGAQAARYLERAQNRDGGFGAAPGQASSRLYSGWAALGLAARGHNPRDVSRRGGRSLAAYVARAGRASREIGETERTVMVLRAAGLSARRFGGRDLVAEIQGRRRADGSIAGFVSYTAFGVLALRSAGVAAGPATVAWLTASQNEDGAFGVARSSAGDTDMTGATLQALAVTGRRRGAVARRAVAFLRSTQNRDGGFGQGRGRDSNAQSTSYAVQGLVAVGGAPGALSRALGYLRRMQRPDGSVAYSRTSTQTPVWVTAQALAAFSQRPLPVPVVARDSSSGSGRKAPVQTRADRAATAPRAASGRPPQEEAAGRGEVKPPRRTPARGEAARDPAPPATLSIDKDEAAGREDDSAGDGPGALLIGAAVLGALAMLVPFRRRLLRPRGQS